MTRKVSNGFLIISVTSNNTSKAIEKPKTEAKPVKPTVRILKENPSKESAISIDTLNDCSDPSTK